MIEERAELKMRRSKLEMYIAILNVLNHKGPLKLTHVMYKANINCSILNEYLEFPNQTRV